MSRPWMPLYIADYLADTAHLSAAEHGAYLLLIMHYWQAKGLPDDDRRLARIARMDISEWVAARPVIQAFFGDNWSHSRIDGEIAEADRLSKAGRDGGKASAEARRDKRRARPKSDGNASATIDERSVNDSPNDFPTKCEAPLPQPLDGGGGDAPARENSISKQAFQLADRILELAKVDPEHPMAIGGAYAVQSWLNEGASAEIILIAVQKSLVNKRDGPPGSFSYFARPVSRERALAAVPALPSATVIPMKPEVVHVQPNGQPNTWFAAAERIRARRDGTFAGGGGSTGEAGGLLPEPGDGDARLLPRPPG